MKTADQAANTTTSRPAALESLEKLIANRLDRIDRLTLGAWKELSPGNMNQARCQELARLAVRQANLAARDVRRVWVLCRPAPGWARRARQRLMVARMELGELDRHRERSCSPVGG